MPAITANTPRAPNRRVVRTKSVSTLAQFLLGALGVLAVKKK
jgi:hypothetical protein